MSIEEVEKQIRESAPLSDRLADCKDRIGKMCAEGRPPKMSIPAQWNDDDLFICTTLSDAQAVERERDKWRDLCVAQGMKLRMKEDALSAAQGEVERLRVAIEAGVYPADFVAGEAMNEANYASLEASKRLVEAGIVLETEQYHTIETYEDSPVWCEVPTEGTDARPRPIKIKVITTIPAPSMAEVWRELPRAYTTLELNGTDTIAIHRDYRTSNTNPTDALIDLLILVRKEADDDSGRGVQK